MPINTIMRFLEKYIDKKKSGFRKKPLRSENFWYRGVQNRNQPRKIELDSGRPNFEKIQIVFNPFNDRFNIFGPSVKKYNIRRLRLQTAKSNAYSKEYTRNLHLFHNDKFSSFIIKSIENKKKVPIEPFEVLKSDSRIKWLIGSIGCGKSTLISHLCHSLIEKVNKGEYTIMCINFYEDKLTPYYKKEVDKITNENADNHEAIVYAILNDAFSKSFIDIPRISSVDDFVKVVKKYFINKPLTIVIDNLDTFYDQSSMLILKQPECEAEYQEFFKNQKYTHIAIEWLNFILAFLEDPNAPANVDFIFGIRCETYDALISTVKNQLTNPAIGVNLPKFEKKFLLEHPDIKDVINKRFDMIEDDSLNKGDHADLKKFFNKYGKYSIDLKVHGMRHLISSLNAFCGMNGSIFYPEWMIDVYVYLDGLEKYSQCDCGILNIFLVNINYRIDGDKRRSPRKYPEFSKKDHFQTYWLRYFLSLFFHKKITKEAVDADTLYTHFSEYGRGVFNSSLFSLTKDTHGRLVSCNHNHNSRYEQDYILEKQDRLDLFFSKKIFFSFTYLAVIIDDDYLEIPELSDKKSCQLLKEIFEKPFIYKSMFARNDSWKEWLFLSIKKVYIFLSILKASFERYEHGNVKFIDSNDINFTSIFNDVERQIREIANSLSISNERVNKEISDAISFNKKIDKQLVNHFKQYKSFVKKRNSVNET